MIKKKLIYLTIICFISVKSAFCIENEILLKINNEIITKFDVENESRYLIALNQNIRDLKQDEIFEISKKSIIKEKIKLIEILNKIKDPQISEKYLNLIFKNIYQKIGLNNLDEFKKYLKNENIDYHLVKKKIETEAIWNELIMIKFSSKIKIIFGFRDIF